MHHVDLPDVRLAVHTRGGGQPLLLLHAFPLDHGMWRGQEPLADTLRLVVPDQRGFGRSAGSVPASIAQLADDAVALLDGLGIGEPVIVGGLSMGGYVAQHVAVRHPHRVAGLVLVDTRLEADTPEARANRHALSERVARLGQEIVAAAMVPNLLAASAEARANPRRQEIEALLRDTILATPVDTIRAALAALGDRPDMVEAMRGVRVPTLLVVGAEDAITPPACLERAAGVLPDARLVIVPGAGHMAPLEAPAAFNAAVREFLREAAAV